MTDVELDASYAKYLQQTGSHQPSNQSGSSVSSQAAQMSDDDLDASYERYLAQTKSSKPQSKVDKFMSGLSSAYQGLKNTDLGNGISSIAGGIGDFAQDVGYGVAQPTLDLAQGTQNLISRGLSKVTGLPVDRFGTYHDDLTNQAPDPYIAKAASIPGALLAPGGALLKGATGANALLRGAGLGAGYGAAYGAAHDNNNNVLSDMTVGALAPAGLSAAGKVISKGIGMPLNATTNLIKQKLAEKALNKVDQKSQIPYSQVQSPQQAAQTLNTTGNDIPLDLGTLVNDVKLSNKYKKSSNFWGSNNEDRMSEAIGKTDQIANNIAQEITQGKDEAGATEAVAQHIKDNYNAHNNEFQKLDDTLSQAAKGRHVDTDYRPNSGQAATDILNDMKDVENKGGYHFLSNNPSLEKLIENIKSGSSPVSLGSNVKNSEIPNPRNYQDLKDLRTYVGKQVGALKSAPLQNRDQTAINGLGKIYWGLDSDMGQALESHPDLAKMWKDRSSYYKQNLKPYDQNQKVNDIVTSDEHTNLFNKLNSTDSDVGKVIDDMDTPHKKLLLGLGMKGALKEDLASHAMEGNAARITSAYRKLNNSPIFKRALDENDHELFRKLGTLSNLTNPYRPLLKNPETGAKNTKLLEHAASVAPAALAGLAGAMGGEGLKTTALAALGTAATLKYKNMMSDILANPKTLEAYANPNKRKALLKEAINNINPNKSQGIVNKIGQKAYQSLSNPSVANYLLNMEGM